MGSAHSARTDERAHEQLWRDLDSIAAGVITAELPFAAIALDASKGGSASERIVARRSFASYDAACTFLHMELQYSGGAVDSYVISRDEIEIAGRGK